MYKMARSNFIAKDEYCQVGWCRSSVVMNTHGIFSATTRTNRTMQTVGLDTFSGGVRHHFWCPREADTHLNYYWIGQRSDLKS